MSSLANPCCSSLCRHLVIPRLSCFFQSCHEASINHERILHRLSALFRFILVYAALYGAFGMASPFMPAFLAGRGLEPQQLGVVLAAGTALRLISAAAAGPSGDRLQALRAVLILCLVVAALATLAYLPARGFQALLALNLMQAAALGPVTILADALALDAAARAAPRFTRVRIWPRARHRFGGLRSRNCAFRAGGRRLWLERDHLG